MPATTPISHRKCTGGVWSAEPPFFYNGKWGKWRAHIIEAPWPNFRHGSSIFMILSHISSIENFSMKKCVFLVQWATHEETLTGPIHFPFDISVTHRLLKIILFPLRPFLYFFFLAQFINPPTPCLFLTPIFDP